MIRPAALLAATLWAAPAEACPPPAPDLLAHSCWGKATADLMLLPQDHSPPLAADAQRWTVTGVYTGRDRRPDGAPNPVGLFVDGGTAVNTTLARMDGVLILDQGRPSLHHRARVQLGGRRYDLTDPAVRMAFAIRAAADGLSVAQSHLIVVDGQLDTRPRQDAPRFVRRMLFEDAFGFGLWQSRGALSLHDAGAAILAEYAPRMALNLDMGSYDFCEAERAGAARDCGGVPRRARADFSNWLAVTLVPAP
ncbi:MAG: hypothetical protein AAGC57_04660 [Pseudomonadota bacterium]